MTITSDHYARGSTATFDYANLVLTGMGRLRAATLDAPLSALAVWDPRGAGAPGGSSSNVALWKRQEMEIDFVDIGGIRGEGSQPETSPAPSQAEPPMAPGHEPRHQIRAMLFADAVGYSKLTEDQIPGYITGFLGAVAELGQRTARRYQHVETSGYGL